MTKEIKYIYKTGNVELEENRTSCRGRMNKRIILNILHTQAIKNGTLSGENIAELWIDNKLEKTITLSGVM